MKQKKYTNSKDIPLYPGAATPRYFTEKLLEAAAAIASGAGCITVLLFFLLL